jgi:hypothetical protein
MPKDFKWRGKLWVGKPLVISTGTGLGDTSAQRTDATDRRSYRLNETWQPLSGYKLFNPRAKPLGTLSLTNNYVVSKEDAETTGTGRHTESVTFPDLILTMNNVEDMIGVNRVVNNSRLVYKNNIHKTETTGVSRSLASSWGTDYNFQFLKKFDVATSVSLSHAREDNLVTNQLTSQTDTLGYSIQTRIPFHIWAFTPRYERQKTDGHDSVRVTNDLVVDTFSLQIYGDITKPIGIRFGRREIGLANRLILNSNLKYERRRSAIDPGTNFVDTYSATASGDYTISQNFRLAIGGNFSQENHGGGFQKFSKTVFGLNSTLTIQF